MRVCDLSGGLLAYYVGTEHIYALLIGQQGQVQRFALARCAEVFPRIDHLLDVLERPYAWSISQRNRVIGEFCDGWGAQLLPPADVLRAYDVLTFIPHHFLHAVPFHIISSGDEPLASRHGIAYCPSGTLLRRCVERNRARQLDTSAWTFSTGGDESGAPSPAPEMKCVGYGVDVLTNNNAEYRKLAQTFGAEFHSHEMVETRSDIKGVLDIHVAPQREGGVPDAICLVCHGYYDALQARRSGLFLTGHAGVTSMRNIRVHGDVMLHVRDHPFASAPVHLDPQPPALPFGMSEVEMLSTSELQVHCQANVQLVALFGCSTGTGAMESNDDYVSHACQWLKTGAASVVANLWEADFRALTHWTGQFSKNWVRHRQPKAIAAREATRSLLDEFPEFRGQPAFWGSVALLGDWL